jgi:hypothetical protein
MIKKWINLKMHIAFCQHSNQCYAERQEHETSHIYSWDVNKKFYSLKRDGTGEVHKGQRSKGKIVTYCLIWKKANLLCHHLFFNFIANKWKDTFSLCISFT